MGGGGGALVRLSYRLASNSMVLILENFHFLKLFIFSNFGQCLQGNCGLYYNHPSALTVIQFFFLIPMHTHTF